MFTSRERFVVNADNKMPMPTFVSMTLEGGVRGPGIRRGDRPLGEGVMEDAAGNGGPGTRPG